MATKATIPWNSNQLAKAVMNKSLAFDNAIQRGFVWDVKRCSMLIDSILRGYPVPPIYTIRTNEKVQTPKGMVSVYDCIDGKQRCNTLAKFLNDEFALDGLDTFTCEDGTEVDINGKKFSELDEDMQDTIKSYGFTVYYFSDITDEEIAEMMSRLNNGKALTGIENARIKALSLDAIIRLASHPFFTENLSESAIKGYANEDIVMKTLLLSSGDSELSTKNVRAAYEHYDLNGELGKQKTEKLYGILTLVAKAVEDLNEKVAEKTVKKKTVKKIVSKTNLINILYIVGCFKEFTIEPDDLAEALAEFFAPMDKPSINDEYNEACTNGTMHGTNVETRNEALMNFLQDKFGEENYAYAF